MELGYHLNVRDPDDIALEPFAPKAVLTSALRELRNAQRFRRTARALAAQLERTVR